MLGNSRICTTKTMEGRLIEGIVGLALVIITAPIVIISIIGNLCGRILDAVSDFERGLDIYLRERGL